MSCSSLLKLALQGTLLLMLPKPIATEIYSKDIPVRQAVDSTAEVVPLLVIPFGFLSGGTANIKITCTLPPGPIKLIIMTDDQYTKIASDGNVLSCGNSGFFAVRTVRWAMYNHTQENMTFNFGTDLEAGFYQFGIQTCSPAAFLMEPLCRVNTVLLNPGGEHLSSDMIELPRIYKSLTIYWGITIGLWGLNALFYVRMSNRLHKISLLAPVLKLTGCILYANAYELNSQEEASVQEHAWAETFGYFAITYSFFILLLTADGYCILRSRLECEVAFHIFAAPALASVALVLQRFVHRYFLAMTVVFMVIVVISLLKTSGRNTMMLRARLSEIELLQPNGVLNERDLALPLRCKRFLIEGSRLIFTMYIVLWALLGIFEVSLVNNRQGQILLDELLDVFLVTSLLWLLRLRNFRSSYIPFRDVLRSSSNENDDNSMSSTCSIVQLPGVDNESICLGVNVLSHQFETFMKTLSEHTELLGPTHDQ